ncbi:MAG: hypothetical protein AVDCRST_MAG77-5028, partial [uncultured Chloroflexi bacterium]
CVPRGVSRQTAGPAAITGQVVALTQDGALPASATTAA